MINQGRYIINAFLIFFVIVITIVFFKTIFGTDHQPGSINPTVLDTTKPSPLASRGEKLFNSVCAACHALDKDLTGPHLRGVLAREPYNGDAKKVMRWIQNPPMLVNTDPYYRSLSERFGGVIMPPQIMSDEDFKALMEYLNRTPGSKTM